MDPEQERASAARRWAREQERRPRPRRELLVVLAGATAVALLGAAIWGFASGRVSGRREASADARTTAAADGRSADASSAAAHAPKGAASSATGIVAASTKPYDWARRRALIAHGFGSIGGLTVTSTREAFETNYRRGYRIFEVDLVFTRDGYIVGRHDWSAARFKRFGQKAPVEGIPTHAEYMRMLVKGTYHPVDAAAIVDLMKRYPDAWVMTDLKIYTVASRAKALKQLLSAAGNDESIRRRLIVQIYDEVDVKPTKALGISNLLYTFYRLKTPVAQALDFAKRNGIKVITIPIAQASRGRIADIRSRGLICAVHTINDAEQVTSLRARGVTLVYSDSLKP